MYNIKKPQTFISSKQTFVQVCGAGLPAFPLVTGCHCHWLFQIYDYYILHLQFYGGNYNEAMSMEPKSRGLVFDFQIHNHEIVIISLLTKKV